MQGEDLDRYHAAIDLANAGRFDEAIGMLDELIATTQQDELKLVAQAQRDSLVEVRLETENITLYNKAIMLANDHKFEESLKTLEELLQRDLDRALRTEAEKVKRQVAGVVNFPARSGRPRRRHRETQAPAPLT